MKMRTRVFGVALLVVTFAILGGAVTYRRSTAETKALPESPQVKRTDRGEQFESEIFAFERKVVTRTPFSATLVIEQTPEGSSETRTITSLIYRDADGRTRRDQMRANSANEAETTTINDAVAGFGYILKHSDKTAQRTKFNSHAEDKSRESFTTVQSSVAAQPRAGSYQMLPVPADGNLKGLKSKAAPAAIVSSGSNSESLGEKEIEGVMAEGTRIIVNVPAGVMGNERPLEIVTERWYSPKLNAVVLMERLDPRFGRSVYRLTGIQRNDPSANLFSVPGDYKVLVE
jgi:hypothetical protein